MVLSRLAERLNNDSTTVNAGTTVNASTTVEERRFSAA